MERDNPSERRTPLVLAIGTKEAEQFMIIEGSTTAPGGRHTPKAYGPMREEKLRATLASDFEMETDEIERSVDQARQHRSES